MGGLWNSNGFELTSESLLNEVGSDNDESSTFRRETAEYKSFFLVTFIIFNSLNLCLKAHLHLHQRKRVHLKEQEYPHPNPKIHFLDDLVSVISIVFPLSTFPQIYRFFLHKMLQEYQLLQGDYGLF